MPINAQSLGNEPSCMQISSPSWFVGADQFCDTEIVRFLDKLPHKNTGQVQCSVLLIVTNAKDESPVDSDSSKGRKTVQNERLKNMQPAHIVSFFTSLQGHFKDPPMYSKVPILYWLAR